MAAKDEITRLGDRTDASNGDEDIDEVFAQGTHLHIEKMSNNCYMVALGDGEKQLLLFIGHWPKGKNARTKLTMNIAENTMGAKWHY